MADHPLIDLDGLPSGMEFFRWSGMDQLSCEAIGIIHSHSNGPNEEVNSFYCKLMQFYYKMRALERSIEKVKKENENRKQLPSGTSNLVFLDDEEDDDVQIIGEQPSSKPRGQQELPEKYDVADGTYNEDVDSSRTTCDIDVVGHPLARSTPMRTLGPFVIQSLEETPSMRPAHVPSSINRQHATSGVNELCLQFAYNSDQELIDISAQPTPPTRSSINLNQSSVSLTDVAPARNIKIEPMSSLDDVIITPPLEKTAPSRQNATPAANKTDRNIQPAQSTQHGNAAPVTPPANTTASLIPQSHIKTEPLTAYDCEITLPNITTASAQPIQSAIVKAAEAPANSSIPSLIPIRHIKHEPMYPLDEPEERGTESRHPSPLEESLLQHALDVVDTPDANTAIHQLVRSEHHEYMTSTMHNPKISGQGRPSESTVQQCTRTPIATGAAGITDPMMPSEIPIQHTAVRASLARDVTTRVIEQPRVNRIPLEAAMPTVIDPFIAQILSNHMIQLNKKIEDVNQIKSSAVSLYLQPDACCMKVNEPLNLSHDILILTSENFEQRIQTVLKNVDKMISELIRRNKPSTSTLLVNRLQCVKDDVTEISKRAEAAVHNYLQSNLQNTAAKNQKQLEQPPHKASDDQQPNEDYFKYIHSFCMDQLLGQVASFSEFIGNLRLTHPPLYSPHELDKIRTELELHDTTGQSLTIDNPMSTVLAKFLITTSVTMITQLKYLKYSPTAPYEKTLEAVLAESKEIRKRTNQNMIDYRDFLKEQKNRKSQIKVEPLDSQPQIATEKDGVDQSNEKCKPSKIRSQKKRDTSDYDMFKSPSPKKKRDDSLPRANSSSITPPSDKENKLRDRSETPEYSAHESRGISRCAFCEGLHDPVYCMEFKSYNARHKRKDDLNLCIHCLSPCTKEHHRRCQSFGKACSHCGKHKSHKALCQLLGEKQRP